MLKEKNNYDYMDQRLPDDGGRSLEDIISAVGEQELAEIPHVPMTPERLAALAAARDADENLEDSTPNHEATDESLAAPTTPADTANKGKKRLYKLVGGIAAVFVLIVLGAVITFNALSVDVGADKKQKEEIVTEDGVVIEDGGYGASDNTEGVWSTEDWDAVAAAKTLYPELMILEYIPEGYDFEQLKIEELDADDIVIEYLFKNIEKESLEIEMYTSDIMLMSLDIDNVTRILDCERGEIYIQEEETKRATIQLDGGTIVKIWFNFSDEELLNIIENLTF